LSAILNDAPLDRSWNGVREPVRALQGLDSLYRAAATFGAAAPDVSQIREASARLSCRAPELARRI
jgi:hypothetical protein